MSCRYQTIYNSALNMSFDPTSVALKYMSYTNIQFAIQTLHITQATKETGSIFVRTVYV